MKTIVPSADEVRAMRERDFIGLQQAQQRLMRANAKKQIAEAETLEDVKRIVGEALEHLL